MLIEKLFGTTSQRAIKKIQPVAEQIHSYEDVYRNLSDLELRAKTDEFKSRYQAGESLDSLLPEAFAVVSEASMRVLGMRPYHVQLLGGIILHQGRIAEMRTGEGKTLVAAMPSYLNAISGKGVHVITVNDYLAQRDSEQIGKIHRFLGLTVGLIVHDMNSTERKTAYQADITYGTNNEIGFDYLRDNMATSKGALVQRGLNYAIIDEVDSILIDEARTPLIISGTGDQPDELYQRADQFARQLNCYTVAESDDKEFDDSVGQNYDYVVEEKRKHCTLTERGIRKAEQFFQVSNLADPENANLSHYINQAIRAHGVMHRDSDYVVLDNEVLIVDEHTGRLMYGRRYNDGLHQAIETKEGIKVGAESKTLATITFQNLFRQYHKLSGMTGTAMTESDEFADTYSLDIVEVPTNKPVQRIDHEDRVYKTAAGKWQAIINDVVERHAAGQPVLIGTSTIDKSEHLSRLLRERGIPHHVLNAKNHKREAEIIAQAGEVGAVTVATNMAGRGTDILLGGNAEFLAAADLRDCGYASDVIADAVGFASTEDPAVLEARALYRQQLEAHKQEINSKAEQVRALGGLCIIGSERHESRRIDNQLRGRAGRQGDPGESQFYLSLEDDVFRLFGSERMKRIFDSMRIPETEAIDTKLLSGAIENAQKKVESVHYQARKSVLEYDDVMNTQRMAVYADRRRVLDGTDLKPYIMTLIDRTIAEMIAGLDGNVSRDDLERVLTEFRDVFLPEMDVATSMQAAPETMTVTQLRDELIASANKIYQIKEQSVGGPFFAQLERIILLRVVDQCWIDQLGAMEDLKRGIGLHAYGQEDPVKAYKREGAELYELMNHEIQRESLHQILSLKVAFAGEVQPV